MSLNLTLNFKPNLALVFSSILKNVVFILLFFDPFVLIGFV